MKPKILYTSIAPFQPWMMPLWQDHVDVEPFDPDRTYDVKNCMVMIDDRYDKRELYQTVKSQGYRTILDYTWDTNQGESYQITDSELVLKSSEWIRIHEPLMWRHKNYHVPREQCCPDKFFLLLMNQKRDNRDQLLNAATLYLNDSLYSYVQQGKLLPGDEFVPHPMHGATANDRFYRPEWYSQTSFSLVSETFVSQDLFVSEKIFKPLAYWHPLVVFGTPQTLSYIQSLGFETFHHMIDESYDTETNAVDRLQKIIAVVDDLYREFKQHKMICQDPKTKEILQHNHNLFFDMEKVSALFTQQLLNPVLEFANRS